MDHVRVQELKPSGRDSGVSWGPVWGEPAGLPTWPPAEETLRPLPSLGEILPSAAHTGLHIKPVLLPRGVGEVKEEPQEAGQQLGDASPVPGGAGSAWGEPRPLPKLLSHSQ